jgi:hypothetical protein
MEKLSYRTLALIAGVLISFSASGARITAEKVGTKINVTIEYQGVSSNVTLTEKGLTEGYSQQQFKQYSISFKLLPYPEVNKQPTPDTYELLLK